MTVSSSWFGLFDLLLVFAAVVGFAVWQLRDLAREKRRSASRPRAEPARAHDTDEDRP